MTGGSPRLLAILARFGAGLSFSELMAGLLDLIDDHTEYFRSHIEALPAQERRVYLALADLWKPAPAREIADRARLDTSQCSAQLARLAGRGAVEVTGGSPRRKLYYLTERLYNIYYLMRRASGPAPLIEALVRFMVSYYAPAELTQFGKGIVLGLQDRSDEALVAWDEVLRHLEASEASHDLGMESTETRWRGYLIRALAMLKSGNPSACERDVVTILALLPDMSVLPKEILDALQWLGHAIGPEWLRELIVASPSAGLLLPLTTALEGELGIESRVAREVEEVAEDIRQDFTKMERSWTGASLEK